MWTIRLLHPHRCGRQHCRDREERRGTEEKAKRKDEVLRDFGVKSERIHTVNQLIRAYALYEKDVEYVVMDGKVKIVDEQTGRILEGRRYSDGLHQAIESKEKVKVEAATQTYATVTLQNYFRMYHKLAGMTGTAETEAQELWDIYKLDVMVIPTNRPIGAQGQRGHGLQDQAREVQRGDRRDRETAGSRPARSGGYHQCGGERADGQDAQHARHPAQRVERETAPARGRHRGTCRSSGTVTIATNMAGRGTDIKLGARREGSRRSGHHRHGETREPPGGPPVARTCRSPGRSRFFAVLRLLEDDLMRMFGSERIAKLMDRLGLKEGEVIQHSMVTASIERAQKKVEENNFGIRKRLLEYDDVMNKQRQVIYKRRRNALFGERLKLDVLNMFHEVATASLNEYQPEGDFDGFQLELFRKLSIESPVDEAKFKAARPRTRRCRVRGAPWKVSRAAQQTGRAGAAGDQ
jgi:preprotein translocase subunit SecA